MANRVFLGFSLLPAEVKALGQLQQRLDAQAQSRAQSQSQGALPGVAVAAYNLHLTLAFLGQADARQQASLGAAITVMPRPGFSQRLDTLVHWPGAKVVCLWGRAQDPGLIGMYRQTQQIAQTLGLHVSEHEFNPHITLRRKARVFTPPAWRPEPMTLTPDKLHLYHSLSTPRGVRYRIVSSWPLTLG